MKRPKTQCVFIKLESGFELDSKLRVTVTSNPPVKAPVKLNPAINVATQIMTAIRAQARPTQSPTETPTQSPTETPTSEPVTTSGFLQEVVADKTESPEVPANA